VTAARDSYASFALAADQRVLRCGHHQCHAVLCCAVPCRAVLCCAVLCCAVPCCAVLCCAVLCRAVLQTLAYRKILGGLAEAGLLKGDVDDMIEAEVGGIFMPHGKERALAHQHGTF